MNKENIICPKCLSAFMKIGWTSSVLECPKCGHFIEGYNKGRV